MKSNHERTLTNRALRQLDFYDPADGPTIEVHTLARRTSTSVSIWCARLIGEASSPVRRDRLTKILPLLGRVIYPNRIVVLASSFVEWFAFYNPGMTREQCQQLTDQLVADTEKARERRRMIHEESLLAGKIQAPGKQARPKPPKREGWKKEPVATDVFKVWR